MRDPLVALVTGANRGIGLEVCRQLAARGHRTILSGRDEAHTQKAAQALQGEGLDVSSITLDVAKPESVARAAREIERRFDGVDVLINNAAALIAESSDLLDTSLDDLRSTFETNVFGLVAVSLVFVPAMVERRFGRVVNVSSTAGQLATMTTYAAAYSISKTAVNAITRQLAAATRGSGVLVNAVCPGWVRTRMGGRHAPKSVEAGADTIVWLATLPANGPTGGFYQDRKQIEW
jgi:NAD(P)-dependent dehydrogenase (short-subunit alcohol dehydrogenase family)